MIHSSGNWRSSNLKIEAGNDLNVFNNKNGKMNFNTIEGCAINWYLMISTVIMMILHDNCDAMNNGRRYVLQVQPVLLLK